MNHASYSLTKTQKRIWFNSKASEQATPNIVMVFELTGNVDVWAINRAIELFVDETEVLKSTIYASGSHLERIINPSVRGNIEFVDLAQPGTETDVFWLLKNIAAIRFNLNTGPLFYFHLIKTSSEHFYFSILLHPIVVDRYSLKYLVEEISRHYNNLTQHTNQIASAGFDKFNLIIELEKEFHISDKHHAGLTHWINTLKTSQFYLDLPRKGYFPHLGLGDSPFFEVFLEQDLRDQVMQFSSSHDIHFSTVLLAAYQALLYKYTGSNDIIVNRSCAVTYSEKKVFGCLENRLPLRVLIHENSSFHDLIKLTKAQLTYDNYYKDIQVNDIVRAIRNKYDARFSGVFSNTSFDENYLPYAQLRLGTVTVKLIPKFMRKFVPEALALYYHDTGSNLSLIADFDETIDSVAVKNLLCHYKTLLTKCLCFPNHPVAKQNMLPSEEYKTLIFDWNNTEEDYPQGLIHRLLEKQVELAPQAIAIVYQQKKLTYQELNVQANQLAHVIKKRIQDTTQRDKLVGICLPRSLEMVISMVAILKAGAAYVPLDPSYPEDRLRYILQDTQISVLISTHELVKKLSFIAQDQRYIICLDKAKKQLSKEPKNNLATDITPDNLAYVIYTSGSTGTPKGVMIEHRNLPNLIYAFAKYFHLAPEKHVLQFSSMNFDAVIPEVFSTLAHGATIYVVPEELRQSTDKLIDFLRDNTITTAVFPPALLKILPRVTLPALETLAFAGDVCDQETIDYWSLGRRFINGYGPTECTVYSTYGLLQPGDMSNRLGKPLPNYYAYILDKHLQPIPIGMIGELYIGGIGVGRGYVNRAAMTAERFIANPFTEGRIYKTGDLVRYHADGKIEYIGRADFEVKIRGFRIQLSDIEYVLQQLPGVKQVTTKVWQKSGMEKVIAVYYVLKKYGSLAVRTLREHLQKQLPDYMMPGYFVELDAIPISVNGKINQSLLPDPFPRASSGNISTPEEQKLKEIWTALFKLPVDLVTANSDFFELGGHSLLATQLLSRIKNILHVDVTIKDIFQHSQLRQMAKLVKESQALTNPLILQKAPQQELYYPAHSQKRLWYFFSTHPTSATYNILFSILFTGNMDVISLKNALLRVLSRHHSFHVFFVEENGDIYIKIAKKLTYNIPIIHCKSQNEIQKHIDKEKNVVFNLDSPPLWQCKLLSHNNNVTLIFNIHHILFDGGSLDVFMRELEEAYHNHHNATRSPEKHSTKPYDFLDYAHSQKQWLDSGVFNHQLAYWQKKLFKPLPILELPTDLKRPAIMDFKGDCIRFSIPENIVAAAKKIAATNKCSLFSLFLSTYYIFLYHITHQQDLLVASPIANRTQQELENLIGLCANVVTYRIKLSEELLFEDFIKVVNEDVLLTQDNQDLPFDSIVSQIQEGRDTSRNPIFQTMFVLQSGFKLSNHWPDTDITYSITEEHTRTAKFDITLVLYDNSAENTATGYFEFNTDLFLQDTVARYTQYFINILRSVTDNPQRTINSISLLSPDEYTALVYDNNKDASSLSNKVIYSIFEQQVKNIPDNVALVYQDQQLTYQQLNIKANQLARYIFKYYELSNKRSLLPDTFIGLCVDRGMEMIIGILAILKTGAAYLPLDPRYPKERLSYMLADSNTQVIITKQCLLAQHAFLQNDNYHIICFDKEKKAIETEAVDNLPLNNKPTDLAYLIYTSGSTGKPKGVAVEHKGIPNLAYACQEAFQINEKSKALQFASINFDAAVLEIFQALLHGAALHIVAEEIRVSPEALINYLDNHHIHIAVLPPALLRILPKQKLPALRVLAFGGDICDQETVDFWSQNRGFFNMYGPTEASVAATYARLYPKDPANRIGNRLKNTKLYVLDKHLNPVPVGVFGELYIGGIGLARGYWHRQNLTVERFIVNPFSDDPAERIYKTGDIVRWGSNHELEYIGRTDFQVQIRGFRVEPGEIEELLNQYPAIAQAAVTTFGNDISKQLVAYYTEKISVDVDTLRKYLQSKLPDYMVPSIFMKIDVMPLSPNGKIDKKSLPIPSESIIVSQSNYIAPRNDTEEGIEKIWRKLFNYEKIGARDNFFSLGGNSLLSIRMLSHIKSELNITINLTQFFQHPTIEGLAELIAGKEKDKSTDAIAMAIQDAKIRIIKKSVTYPDKINLQHILLTGANGFLGVYLLQELLHQTSATIHCLIRCSKGEDVKKKMQSALLKYNMDNLLDHKRIKIIKGDLSKPNLSMSSHEWEFLALYCDAIYHNGALVNHIYDYPMLKSSNVNSTIELLKLADTGKKKLFHYISTLSAASQFDRHGCALETGPGKKPPSDSGYILTKWVSERILETAAKKGLRITIFRPGNITGHSQSGATSFEFNHALLLLKSCIQLGVAPHWQTAMEMTPVDILSRAIITLSLQPIVELQVFNMANPYKLTWYDYFKLVNQYGFQLRIISPSEWMEKYIRPLSQDNALYPLRDIYLNNPELSETGPNFNFENHRSQQQLQTLGIEYPNNYTQQVFIYLRYLEQQGFFK